MNKKPSLFLHDQAECIYAYVDEEINNNPQCKALESENRKLGREIMERLGPNRTLFVDYEKIVYLMESHRVEYAYKIGITKIPCQGKCRPKDQ